MGVLVAPSVEDDLWRACWFWGVAVGERDEEEVGWGADPDAVESDGDAGREGGLVEEDGGFVEGAIAFGVFEDEDAVFGFAGAVGVVGIFENPEASAIVEGVGDGLDDIRFATNELGAESLWQNELRCGLCWGECWRFGDGTARVFLRYGEGCCGEEGGEEGEGVSHGVGGDACGGYLFQSRQMRSSSLRR